MNRKSVMKKAINAIVFIGFVGLTFYIIFKNNSITDVVNNLSKVNFFFVFLALLCMFFFVFCEGFNVGRVLKTLGNQVGVLHYLKYALVGFFFSSVTPSSSGGEPMQLYYMKKDGIPLIHSALALLIELLSFQVVTGILAIVGFMYNYDILIHQVGNIKYLMFLGITINIVISVGLIIMIFSKRIAIKILAIVCKLLRVFRYKKVDTFYEKSLQHLDDYHKCSIYLKNNKKMFVKIILTTFIQIILYHSIPYFIYLAFGLTEASAVTFILMQAVLYISVASLPFPGAVGVSEGSFMIMFKMFFPTAILSSAMIVSRGVSFYLFVIISGLVIVLFMVADRYKKRKRHSAKETLSE